MVESPGTPLARAVYGLAARFSAGLLSLSSSVESVHLHRSVATGEVVFGRSDIDLVVQLSRSGYRGAALASLCRYLGWVRLLNPALTHVEVFGPDALESYARRDSVWCSMERRTLKRLIGFNAKLPVVELKREDALRRFLLWWELYFPLVLQKRDPRNLQKIALECWNFFAVAEGILEEPLLLRSAMKAHLQQHRSAPDLTLPHHASRFILELVDELHSSRRPPVEAASSHFSVVVSPHQVVRSCLVLPGPGSELPAEAFVPGTLVATAEALDLMVHYKNAFLGWSLPPSLELQRPDEHAFLRSVYYYCAPHFLCFPGFTDVRPLNPGLRLECLELAMTQLAGGDLPTPSAPPAFPYLDSIEDYYLRCFDSLLQRRDELEEKVLSWLE